MAKLALISVAACMLIALPTAADGQVRVLMGNQYLELSAEERRFYTLGVTDVINALGLIEAAEGESSTLATVQSCLGNRELDDAVAILVEYLETNEGEREMVMPVVALSAFLEAC